MSSVIIQSYRDLLVWKKSIELCKAIYELTKQFPADERFGLTSQLRRACVSVASNIAEGRSRRQKGEFFRFLNYAYGSLAEIETQLIIAAENDFITYDTINPLLDQCSEIGKMINGLIASLERTLEPET